jgi:hypothetical protein
MANQCSREFDSANCQTVPPRCGLDAIADPTPAAKACDELATQLCKRSVKCGTSASEDECLSAEPKLDCSLSVAFKLDYETCIDSVEKLDCGVLVPAQCQSVIISKDPSQQN